MFRERHTLFIVLLLIAFLSSCSPSANMQGDHWVIFSEEQAKEMKVGSWFFPDGQTADYWTPAEDDIAVLESGLGSYLQDHPDGFYSEIPAWERLDDYNRQYFGLLLDGKRIIYANYFCTSVETDWRKDFVMVMDGGDCFFQFKYDVDAGQFFDLQVNGNA